MKLTELTELSVKVSTYYFEKYPEAASIAAKTKEKQIANINNAYSEAISPNIQTTQPDYLVLEFLEHLRNYPKEERNFTKSNMIDKSKLK